MPSVQKIMEPVELKIGREKYYHFLKDNVYHAPNIISTIQDVAIHEGDWDNCSHDSIKVWNYTIGEYQHHPFHTSIYIMYSF